MTDLAVLAAGFGAIPLASILLYSFRAWLDAHREVVWGGFAGVIAFLGLSHAMAFVLEGKPFLFAGNDSLGAASFLLTGLALGGLLGWFLFDGPLGHGSLRGPRAPGARFPADRERGSRKSLDRLRDDRIHWHQRRALSRRMSFIRSAEDSPLPRRAVEGRKARPANRRRTSRSRARDGS